VAYDEKLAARIREILSPSKGIAEKKMFGGVCFLLDGKMVCGVLKNDLIARIGRENHERLGAQKHVRPFDFSGKPMMGMVYVAPEGLKTKKDLSKWVELSKGQAKERAKAPTKERAKAPAKAPAPNRKR
jgi:TfoX/Sxy family transcriptional regulator of competence genes